jgi:hypothetical protein
MTIPPVGLQQRDGVTCGPSVVIVAGALLDTGYAAGLAQANWFEAEQERVHRRLNRLWPRALGTTPAGVVRALNAHALDAHDAPRGIRYRWRLAHGRRDRLLDVREALLLGWPVPMLIGNVIPRHWVLLVAWSDGGFRCYEPSVGLILSVPAAAVRDARLSELGFPRAFAFVLPDRLARRYVSWAEISSKAAIVGNSLVASCGSGQLDSLAATTSADRLT